MLQRGRSGFAWGRLPLPSTSLDVPGPARPRTASSYGSGLASPEDPHPYPGERPDGSFVAIGDDVLPVRWRGAGWEVTTTEGETVPLSTWLDRSGHAGLAERVPILAYGSNLNPGQIRLFAEGRAVVVLRAMTVGLAAAFCTTRRRDGQHPAGVLATDPQRVEVHGLLLVDAGQRDALDVKEGHGARYVRAVVAGTDHPVAVVLEDHRSIVDAITTYVQLAERPLATVDGTPAYLADWSQSEFVRAERTETHDHRLHVSETGDDRGLSAKPLPVFAYGTLRPGESRWPLIREAVQEYETAELRGRVLDTGRGYPGLLLDGSGTVPGVLLHVRPDSFHEAMRLMDGIEGHPELFVRTLVRLVDGRLAWTYAWNGG